MGRLTEYFGTGRGRTDYIDHRPSAPASTTVANGSGDWIVTGVDENLRLLTNIMMSNADMERNVRNIIRKALRAARNDVSKDLKGYMHSDPRQAYRAVKHSVYKQLFGGNISILSKRRRGIETTYEKPRTLQPGQRGGNRMARSPRTIQMEKYGGADRGMVLRWLSTGTNPRSSRIGSRGRISANSMFERIAPWHMQSAFDDIANSIDELIRQEIQNG